MSWQFRKVIGLGKKRRAFNHLRLRSSGSTGAYAASGGEQAVGLDQASDTYDKAPDIASRAGDAEQVASDAASSLRDEVRRVLDRQVNHGADYLGHAASSIRTAAATFPKTRHRLEL